MNGPKIGEIWTVGGNTGLKFLGMGLNFAHDKFLIFQDRESMFIIDKDEFWSADLVKQKELDPISELARLPIHSYCDDHGNNEWILVAPDGEWYHNIGHEQKKIDKYETIKEIKRINPSCPYCGAESVHVYDDCILSDIWFIEDRYKEI